jgi:hypothetical protein
LTIHLPFFSASSKERKTKCFLSQTILEKRTKKGGELPMSAYMVADKTINNVVNWLRRDMDIERFSLIPHKLTEIGFDTGTSGWAERLGYAMFQLNINAVDARYGNGEAMRFRQLNYRYQVTVPVPLVQILKSLQCWLYQCCEGAVPETALYKLFDKDIRLCLMSKIIARLPEYEQADWG